MSDPLGTPGSPKSLPLILARELASNLATPMFLLDVGGMLVFYNDAAAMLLGKPFAELGEIPSGEFGEALQLATPEGVPIRRRDSPAGIAFFERRPAHKTLLATTYDGVRRLYEATAYPLFGAAGEMHGVVAVFWEGSPRDIDG
jgi:PAS domain-containing protein